MSLITDTVFCFHCNRNAKNEKKLVGGNGGNNFRILYHNILTFILVCTKTYF